MLPSAYRESWYPQAASRLWPSCSKTPCPSPTSPSTGWTPTRPRRHANGWPCGAKPSVGCPPRASTVLRA